MTLQMSQSQGQGRGVGGGGWAECSLSPPLGFRSLVAPEFEKAISLTREGDARQERAENSVRSTAAVLVRRDSSGSSVDEEAKR